MRKLLKMLSDKALLLKRKENKKIRENISIVRARFMLPKKKKKISVPPNLSI